MKYVDDYADRAVQCVACGCTILAKHGKVVEPNEKDPKAAKYRCLDEGWCNSHGRNEDQLTGAEASDDGLRRMQAGIDAIRAMTFEPGWLERELVEIKERRAGEAAKALNEQLAAKP